MKVKLIGVMGVDFSNANGEGIQGTNIFVAYNEEGATGLRTDKIFLKNGIALLEQTKINDTLDLSFNHKGKIESINKA